jgi:hypothetical protein
MDLLLQEQVAVAEQQHLVELTDQQALEEVVEVEIKELHLIQEQPIQEEAVEVVGLVEVMAEVDL